MDTIFAPATAAGKAGLSVIRLSGPAAREAAGLLVGVLPQAGRTLRWMRDLGGERLDQVLVAGLSERGKFYR